MPAKISYVIKKPERCAVGLPDGEYTRLRQSNKYPTLVPQVGKLLPRRAAQNLVKGLNEAVEALLKLEASEAVSAETAGDGSGDSIPTGQSSGSQAVSMESGVPLMTPLPVSESAESADA